MTGGVELSPGDRVRVPWGLDSLEGTVLRRIGVGERARLEVLVELPDSEEPEPVLFPATAIEPLQAELVDPETDWFSALKYHERLTNAVVETLRDSGDPQLASTFHLADDRNDIVARTSDGTMLLVEVKNFSAAPREEAVLGSYRQARRHAEASVEAGTPWVLLIVFDKELSGAAQQVAAKLEKANPQQVKFAAWRDAADNASLAHALGNLGVH